MMSQSVWVGSSNLSTETKTLKELIKNAVGLFYVFQRIRFARR